LRSVSSWSPIRKFTTGPSPSFACFSSWSSFSWSRRPSDAEDEVDGEDDDEVEVAISSSCTGLCGTPFLEKSERIECAPAEACLASEEWPVVLPRERRGGTKEYTCSSDHQLLENKIIFMSILNPHGLDMKGMRRMTRMQKAT